MAQVVSRVPLSYLEPRHRTVPELIEEVRSVRRKLLFIAVGAALLAVPVAVVLFRAPPVNLMSHAGTLKCYDKTGNLKAC